MSLPQEHPQAEQQGPPGILFYCFAAVLVYTILFVGMPVAQAHLMERRYRDIFLVATGLLGVVAGLIWGKISRARPESTRRGDRILIWMAGLLPVYALLQWIPLPLSLVALVSPARAELARGLEPLFGKQSFASISLVPAVTLTHFLLLSAYCVMLFAAREFAVRSRRKVWLVAAPVLVAGALESALALIQFSNGVDSVKGTFAIRNHLAGSLEMALPLALAFGVSAISKAREHAEGGERPGLPTWLRAGGGIALAVSILVAGLSTLSRGGFMGILGSLLVVAAFSAGRGVPMKNRLVVMGVLTIVLFGLIFSLTPVGLVERLAQHDSEGRTSLWREGIPVVQEFPLMGTGLGGFQSAFLKFKVAEGPFVIDYAHNDYLQGLSELGIAGFTMIALLLGLVVMRSARMALGVTPGALDSADGAPTGSAQTRWAALGCLGAITAILIHSLVDFNLYVPANAATLAWICGMAAGLTPSQRRRRRTVEVAESLRQRSSARL